MGRRKEPIDDFTMEDTMNNIVGGKVRFKAKNEKQKEFAKLITDKEIVICSGPAGTGKAQPLSSDILTPNGWVKMGDIKVNDKVIGEDGEEYSVIEIHPQGEIDIYEITFSDDTSTKCSGEHLWYTETYNDRNHRVRVKGDRLNRRYSPRSGSVKTTIEIMDSLHTNRGDKNHTIPITNPIKFKNLDVKIDPYILGVLLGDGSITNGVKISTGDIDIVNMINERLSENIKIKKIGNDDFTYSLITEGGSTDNPILTELRNLGLYGCKSENKFIPNNYLFNSISVRLDILRGLMDTDGTVGSDGYHISYTSISKKLIDGVKFIVESLGGVTHIKTKKPYYKDKNGDKVEGQLAYNLTLTLPSDINPFKLKRKVDMVKPKTKYKPKRYITNINYIGKDNCQCISVDNPSNLYLTNDFIVTHNSYVSIARALELLQSKINGYQNILIYKPAVEVEEKYGFLPGTLEEKIMPYTESTLNIIDKIIGKGARMRMMTDGIIQIKALAYIRGANIDNAILIMEEAQNMSPNQMKTLLTRIGENSKFIISGDMDQSDRYNNIRQSGLYDAMNRLKSIEDIGFFEFKTEDIVRNPIISKILKFYNSPKSDTDSPKEVNSKRVIPSVPSNDRAKLSEGISPKNESFTQNKHWWQLIPKYIRW